LHVTKQLIPLLVCQDIPAEHDFLVNVLGFSSGGIHRTAAGQAVHGEVRHGDLAIWLHRVAAELKLASPRSMPAATSGLIVYVDDVDAHYLRARSHGAQPEGEPKDMPYGQREYAITDPEGHRWWFATPLAPH
jgi:uncharacterized glyoxalase superfamily protein PhnB